MFKKMLVFCFLFSVFCFLSFASAQNNNQDEGMAKYKEWLEKQEEDLLGKGVKKQSETISGRPTKMKKKRVKPTPSKKSALTISMDFQDASIKDVLKVFSQQSGLNFIAGQKIKDSRVTLYLEKVSVEDALNTILRGNNLTYEQSPGSDIFIVKETSEPMVETTTRVFELNYAMAIRSDENKKGDEQEDLEQVIENILTEHGKVISYQRTNSLIITDIPLNFERIEKTIKEIDTPTPQVMIEAEILETAVDLLDELGIDWSQGINLTYTAPGEHNTNFPLSEDLVHATGGFTAAKITAESTQAILKALSTDTRARWLAKPKICVLNNEEATIDIVTDAAVGKIVTYDENGNRTETIERMDIGTKLKVTPHVNKEREITLEIEPEVSRAVSSSTAVSGAVDKLRRTAKTIVIVKDGNTIIIAGLISTKKENAVHKVPFFGDVPILGNLFKYEKEVDNQTELIIFITPRVVRYWEKPTMVEETGGYTEGEALQLEPIVVN